MSRPTMTRRQLVLGLGATGSSVVAVALLADRYLLGDAGPGVPATVPSGAPGPPGSTSPNLPPARPVTPLEGVARVGEVYLETSPAPGDAAGLRAALPELTAEDAAGVLDQFPALTTRIRNDFATGSIEVLEGWILARTEVQAAALVALVR